MAYAQVSPASVPLAGSITPLCLLTLRLHRQLCRASKAATPNFTAANTSLTTLESFGYPNGASAGNAIKAWTEIHSLALTTIVNSKVYLEGGVDHNLSSPRAVLLGLAPGELRASGNPAEAFRISHLDIHHKDEKFFLRNSWDELQAVCATRAASEVRTQGSTFAGVISAAFVLGDTGVVAFTEFPIHRLRRTDDTALQAQTRALLSDLVGICATDITTGYSYSRPTWYHRPEPLVEESVRARKGWTKKAVHESIWDRMAAHMAQSTELFKSGMHPREIWAQYLQL